MRVALIIVLWFLVGTFFWWSKSNCCAEITTTNTTVESEEASGISNDGTATMSDPDKHITFLKSAYLLDGDDNDSLIQKLKSQINEGKGLTITGFAFTDEENPRELGMERAKKIRSLIDMPEASIKVRSELISEPFDEAVTFLNYEYYDLEELEEETPTYSGMTTNNEAEERKGAYVFNLSSEPDEDIPAEVKNKLESIAQQLNGNLKKVRVVTHSDNGKVAGKWQRFAEDYLIRYGVIPSRISSSYKSQGDNQNGIIEISII